MLRYDIDHLVLREGQLLVYGWGVYPGSEIVSLVLCLEFGNDNHPVQIEAEYGQQSDDVKALFPGMSEAGNAGFFLIAGFMKGEIARASLRWELKDHRVVNTPLNLSRLHLEKSLHNIVRRYNRLFRKSIALLRSDGFGALANTVKRHFHNRPRLADKVAWDLLCAKLHGRVLTVVVDQDLGGGANIYRDRDISERCAKGATVLLFGFHTLSLQYFVQIFDKTYSHRYAIDSLESVLMLASQGEVQQLIYNCAVSFRQPLTVVDMLASLKKNTGCQLMIAVHDYFIICPSHVLMDNNGRFCGVPDVSECNRCLPQHRNGFVSLANTMDVSHWRDSWSNLLKMANEVHMFSESSRRLLKRAYPSLNDAHWTVVPHTLHTTMPKIDVLAGRHLHVGIVGRVGRTKGANIVRDLASEIILRNSSAKITVIGTLDAKVPDKVVTVTGRYEPERLAEIIKKSGANIFLFPSIIPETFSYVAHELVAMDVPFACFNMGAPADLARTYKKGLVLGCMEAGDVLIELENFWHEIYQTTAKIGQEI